MKNFKKIIGVLCVMAMLSCLTACTSSGRDKETDVKPDTQETTASQQEETDEIPADGEKETSAETAGTDESGEKKVLVAYFSATGTTKKLAEYAADAVGADLYEIVPEEPYTAEDLDYGDSDSRSSVEMDDPDARPAISGSVENMEQYDIVLIGYPIWWGEAPRIMSTFIESYDFSGKTLAAFCTSGGSGFGRSDSALKSVTGDASWLDGERLSSSASREDVVEWINGLGLDVEAK